MVVSSQSLKEKVIELLGIGLQIELFKNFEWEFYKQIFIELTLFKRLWKAKGARNGYTEDNDGRTAEHFAFYNEEYDVVDLILESKKSRDQLDYDNDKCTILSEAFQREKEVWRPWLERNPVGYFHQFLLRKRFIQ